MKIFIAGGSGAIGRSLVPMLVEAGHRVIAMTRSTDRARSLEAMGAVAVVADVYDGEELTRLVSNAEPEIVIHQLTAFGATDADPLEETIRVRIEGTRNLVQAARAAGARRFIAQSISFVCSPSRTGLTNEETSLYLDAPDAIRPLAEAVAELERQTLHTDGIEGVVLRYGWFYGPGTNYDPSGPIPRSIRRGRSPIVGEGDGTYSFIHVDDAARATMKALIGAKSGIYNIVDDDPAPLHEWLPFVAKLLGAPMPDRLDEQVARQSLGDMLVYIMNEQRGASNAKAKRELEWQPGIPSWRDGLQAIYATPRERNVKLTESEFSDVTIVKAANVYFEGKVTSRTVKFADGTTRTLGIMLPGEYDFGTGVAELMEILSGDLDVKLPGARDWRHVAGGESFDVPANSRFQLKIKNIVDYCCSYLG